MPFRTTDEHGSNVSLYLEYLCESVVYHYTNLARFILAHLRRTLCDAKKSSPELVIVLT
ncbi:MAG: hypothetical protein ACI8Z5_000713 [Lentimonas sp.]|jgi:hypothetical protein